MNRKIGLFLFLILFSCKTNILYDKIWIASEQPFCGLSMEIKKNGNVYFFNIPVITPIFTDLEYNIFSESNQPIFDSTQKEVHFDKKTLLINVYNNGKNEKYRIIFAHNQSVELLLENGCIIIFENMNKNESSITQ